MLISKRSSDAVSLLMMYYVFGIEMAQVYVLQCASWIFLAHMCTGSVTQDILFQVRYVQYNLCHLYSKKNNTLLVD